MVNGITVNGLGEVALDQGTSLISLGNSKFISSWVSEPFLSLLILTLRSVSVSLSVCQSAALVLSLNAPAFPELSLLHIPVSTNSTTRHHGPRKCLFGSSFTCTSSVVSSTTHYHRPQNCLFRSSFSFNLCSKQHKTSQPKELFVWLFIHTHDLCSKPHNTLSPSTELFVWLFILTRFM